jgi:hypothetical protein
MNKKILIGSVIVISILIGVSFTSVVGYRSVASDVNASPLFNVRSIRAIDEESEELSCDYVGEGELSKISIPKRDNKTIIIQGILDRISKMSDKTFNRFIDFVISFINQKNINREEIGNALNQLKDNEKRDNFIDWASWNNIRERTFYPCTLDAWFPGC